MPFLAILSRPLPEARPRDQTAFDFAVLAQPQIYDKRCTWPLVQLKSASSGFLCAQLFRLLTVDYGVRTSSLINHLEKETHGETLSYYCSYTC